MSVRIRINDVTFEFRPTLDSNWLIKKASAFDRERIRDTHRIMDSTDFVQMYRSGLSAAERDRFDDLLFSHYLQAIAESAAAVFDAEIVHVPPAPEGMPQDVVTTEDDVLTDAERKKLMDQLIPRPEDTE